MTTPSRQSTAVNYEAVATDYRRTRTLGQESLEAWRRALEPHLLSGVRTILDVGAGTGQFATALADWFGAVVIALEPTCGMRSASTAHPSVHYLGGRAEAVPLESASADCAWLSAVVHHFASVEDVAAELSRVVRPAGLVVVRGFFRNVPLPRHFAVFPEIDRSVAMFPSTSEVTSALMTHAIEVVAECDVIEEHAVRTDWETRLRAQRAADSLLRPLTDDEFESGVASLRSWLANRSEPLEVALRLIVYRVAERSPAHDA